MNIKWKNFINPEIFFTAVVFSFEALSTFSLYEKQPLWFDELYSQSLAKQPLPDLIAALFKGIDSHPPLHYMAIKLSLWFGGSPRLIFVFGYLISLLMLVKLALKLNISPSILLSIYCLSTCKELGWEARPYSILLSLIIYVLHAYHNNTRSSARKLTVMLLLTMLNYTHFFGFIVTGLVYAADFLYANNSLGLKSAIIIGLCSAVSLLQALSAYSHFRQIRIVVQKPDPAESLPSIIASRTALAILQLVSFKGIAYLLFVYLCLPSRKNHLGFSGGMGALTVVACFGLNFLISISNFRYISFLMVFVALHFASKRFIFSWWQMIAASLIFLTLGMSHYYLLNLHDAQLHAAFQKEVKTYSGNTIFTDILTMPVLQLRFPKESFVGVYDSTHPISPLLVGFFGKEYNLTSVKQLLTTTNHFIYLGRSTQNEILEFEKVCNQKNRETIVQPDDRFESLAQLTYVRTELMCR